MKLSRNEIRKKKHSRIRGKISGTSAIPRLTVFKSHQNLSVQLVDDKVGKTLLQGSTLTMDIKYGGNLEAATKLGEDFGKKLKTKKITKIVFDRSGYIYHGRVKAFVEAIRKEGIKV